MNYIITKRIGIRALMLSRIHSPCCIEYLRFHFDPKKNRFINSFLKRNKIKLKAIEMGKLRNGLNISLSTISSNQVLDFTMSKRKEYYDKSGPPLLNIVNDLKTNLSWPDDYQYELLLAYYEKRKDELKENDKIFLVLNTKKKYPSFKLFNRVKTFLSVESFRLFILTLKTFYSFNIFKSKREFKKKIEADYLFLMAEFWPKNKAEFYLRNQSSLAQNISVDNSSISLDFKNKVLYFNDKKLKLSLPPLDEFLRIILKNIPNSNKYFSINYDIDLFSLLRFLRITSIMWRLLYNTKTRRYIANYYSVEAAAIIFLSRINNIPIYFYQGSTVAQMSAFMHCPYVDCMYFTKLHADLYLELSSRFQFANTHIEKMPYPYSSILNENRIKNFREKITGNFDLSIAYFDEAIANRINYLGASHTFYYEDLKYEIKSLLEFAKTNPRIAIVVKSQYVSNSLKKLISNDNDLKDLYNEDQFFDLVQPSPMNARNIITPAEVAKSVDISISTTMGGTAGYEAASVGGRVCFIRSKLSYYDNVLPDNILFDSIDEIILNIKNISCNREKLFDSQLGKFDVEKLN